MFGLQTPIVYVDTHVMWEYLIEVINGEISAETLNALGKDGWQLTAILPRETKAVYYFMRSIKT